tara:strand:+ start:19 stop:414 length:396 start_codon:yes stop_codon:yes gene_type:complete
MSTSVDLGLVEIFGESLAQIVNATVAPRISNLRSSKNSLGEAVISWDLLDPGNNANTFIIVATFDGTTAPLGALPVTPGTISYKFTDSVLNRYVGKKLYRIAIERRDGTFQVNATKVSSTVVITTPPEYFR